MDELEREEILDILQTSGYILFRSSDVDMPRFTAMVERVSSRISLDPARNFHSNVAQKVDAGTDPVGLHCENGNSPFWPDLAWFYCERAATSGSQTTVCDGEQVWAALGDTAREMFTRHDIVYSRRVSEQQWKDYVYHSREGKLPRADITLDHLRALMNDTSTATIDPLDGGAICYRFRTPAARTGRFSGRVAFANSILGPSYNYEVPVITLDSGEPIPAEIMAEITQVTGVLTSEVTWKNGDLLLIDNTRVMHGRRAIVDTRRTIYNALSYV
nr:TauD/TfdA family dioxygenase [Microbulbifer rhizosphaerae]